MATSSKKKRKTVRFTPSKKQKDVTKQADETRLTMRQATLFRERIQTVIDAGKKNSVDLCQMVYESDVNVVGAEGGSWKYCWEAWGYETWEDFLGQEMDLHITTAYNLARVWEVFYIKLGGKWDPELLLGITKMKILTAADLTPKNVEAWLRRAKKMNCNKLRAAVFGTAELRVMSFHLTLSQMKQVSLFLNEVKAGLNEGERMTRGEILATMARDYRTSKRPFLRIVKSAKAA